MEVASLCGAFWGLVACLVFYGVPLGVLGAVLSGVRAGGGFWVAGAGFRRSGARSGRSLGVAGAGVLAPRAALGSGGAFWAGVLVPILTTKNRARVVRPVLGWGSEGAPLGLGYAPKISQRARKSSPLQSSPYV